MKLSTKVARNTIVQVISKVISTILGLLAVAMMTRYLGQFGFGQYTTIMNFLSFFAIAADLGMTLVTAQMISRPDVDEEKAIGNLFALRLVTAFIFLALAPLVVFFFPYSLTVKIGVMITTLSFFFVALNQVLVGLFQKHLRMDKVAIAEVVSRVFLVAGVMLVVYYKWSLLGMMAATIFASFVNFLLHYIFSRKFTKLRLIYDKEVWKNIFLRSWPIAVTIIFNLIYLKTDTLILSLIKSQEEVGVYGAAYKVIDVLITVPFMFAGIILPILTALWATSNREKFTSVMQRSLDAMLILALPMVVGTYFVAEKLMSLVAGNEFAVAGPVLQILIIASGIIFIGCIFAHAVIAIDKQKQIIAAYIFTGITSVIGYMIFIPRFSYFGAAWVTVYSELTIALASFFLVWKYARIKLNLKIFYKTLFSSVIMAIFLWIIGYKWQNLNVLIMFVIGTAVYFLALYSFKGIKKEEIMELISSKNNKIA